MKPKLQNSYSLVIKSGQIPLEGDVQQVILHVPKNRREANNTTYSESYKIATINGTYTLHDGERLIIDNPVEPHIEVKFSGTEPSALPRLEVIVVKRPIQC